MEVLAHVNANEFENHAFFYAVEFDTKQHMENALWADAK